MSDREIMSAKGMGSGYPHEFASTKMDQPDPTIEEDNRYRQGKSPKQMRSSYIGAAISGIGLVLTIILILLDKYLF